MASRGSFARIEDRPNHPFVDVGTLRFGDGVRSCRRAGIDGRSPRT